MTDERVYEVERRFVRKYGPEGWEFVGNLEVADFAMLEALVERAEENDWPDGEYRLLHWDQHFASGSFFLVTLRSERHRRATMAEAEREAAA